MEDVIDDHTIAFDEVGDHRLTLMSDNSQAVLDIVARRPALGEIGQGKTGGAQPFCKSESHFHTAAGFSDITIEVDEIGFRLGPKHKPLAFQEAAFKSRWCIFLRRSKTSSAGMLGLGSSMDLCIRARMEAIRS